MIAVLVVVAIAAGSEPRAEAHVGKRQGLTFQDVRPLTLMWEEAVQGVRVRYCNLDDRIARRVVDGITGFRFKRGGDLLSDDTVWVDPGKLTTVRRGRCKKLRVAVEPEEADSPPDQGEYTGVLVVTSAGAGGARRRVVVTVPAKQETDPADEPPADPQIDPATIKDFSVGGVNFVPSILSPLPAASLGAGVLLGLFLAALVIAGPAATRPARAVRVLLFVAALALFLYGVSSSFDQQDDGFFEGPTLSLVEMSTPLVDSDVKPATVGTLVGKDGILAKAVVRADHELEAQDITRAGAYDGKIDLLPGADGGDATMTANVRDYWAFPLVVIALGVGLGAWLTWYYTVKRARDRLGVKLATLREEIDGDPPPDAYDHYAVTLRMDKRWSDIEELLQSDDPEDAKKAADEIAAARAYFQSVSEMWDQLPKVDAAAGMVEREVTDGEFHLEADDVPGVFRARDLLRTPFDSDAPDTDSSLLTERRKALDEALALLLELARSLPRAARIRDAAKGVPAPAPADSEAGKTFDAHQAALRKAVAELVAAGSADDARKSMSATVAEAAKILEGAEPPDRTEEQTLAAMQRDTLALAVRERRLWMAPAWLTPADAMLGPPTPRPSAAQLRRRFELNDLQMTTLSGALAVLSGLLALYFTSSTWGTPGDYLKAFLWGSVLSEGIKYATSLVNRVRPAAG